MLRSEVTGQRPRAPPWRKQGPPWRKQGWKQQGWKESEGGELLRDARERLHAFDEMRHWREPEQRLLTLRRGDAL